MMQQDVESRYSIYYRGNGLGVLYTRITLFTLSRIAFEIRWQLCAEAVGVGSIRTMLHATFLTPVSENIFHGELGKCTYRCGAFLSKRHQSAKKGETSDSFLVPEHGHHY
jgi:hypothetical protein